MGKPPYLHKSEAVFVDVKTIWGGNINLKLYHKLML
jgi:hypothetical protein